VMAEADHTQLASARLIVPSAIDCAFRSPPVLETTESP
jgi:hypothetical protein